MVYLEHSKLVRCGELAPTWAHLLRLVANPIASCPSPTPMRTDHTRQASTRKGTRRENSIHRRRTSHNFPPRLRRFHGCDERTAGCERKNEIIAAQQTRSLEATRSESPHAATEMSDSDLPKPYIIHARPWIVPKLFSSESYEHPCT